jgi:hypothetical protein
MQGNKEYFQEHNVMWMNVLRRFIVICLAVSLSLTTVGCGGGKQASSGWSSDRTATPTVLSDGKYPVQQAQYNDANGEYTLFLLNSTPPTFATTKLQMARLTDDEIKQGQKTYLRVANSQPTLYLTEDFKIQYVHNVAETRTNPVNGQQETVVVRQESGFWSPFAGALAGQAIGSLLFRPQYYVPPAYQSGGFMTGYGGYGSSYDQAVSSYRSRYNEPPVAVRNQAIFRRTGSIRNFDNSTTQRANTGSRSTGSGFGSNTLNSSGRYNSVQRQSGRSFGSGRSPSMRRSYGGFGSRRR